MQHVGTGCCVSKSEKCLKYFSYALVEHPELKNVNKIQQSSETQFTTERSLRVIITYLCCLALTHHKLRTCNLQTADIKQVIASAQLLNKLVREVRKQDQSYLGILPAHTIL